MIEVLQRAISTPAQGDMEHRPQVLRVTPQTDPAWTETVHQAIRSIESGQLDKVVAARRVRLEASRSFQASGILARLAHLYPSCQLLAINLGGNTVVSATPEQLATLGNRTIRCDALGGTTGRAQESGQDLQLTLRLLNCRKAQHEHALVVDSIQSALDPLCRRLIPPDSPEVIKLRNLQHLWTSIKGTLRNGVGLLDARQRGLQVLHVLAQVGEGHPQLLGRPLRLQHGGLDGVGQSIWQAVSDGKKLGETVDIIVAEYDVDREQATADVIQFANTLVERGLLAE